jgi:predicted Ser/Thr protein kinase
VIRGESSHLPPTLEDRVRRRALKARMFGISDPPVCVGRYALSHALGEGAMGVVYAARDMRLDRPVAIKLLRPEVRQESARIEREARALARLSHPNVVTVHEVGEHDDRTFLVMEMIAGRSLRAWLDDTRTLAERLEVLRQAATGLAAAHRVGVVHRDFKPENAIVGDDGRLRIVDFGLARESGETVTDTEPGGAASPGAPPGSGRLTNHGRLSGTPAYMAPELLAGAASSTRSDQYALCCVAWELLFGVHPQWARARPVAAVRVDRRLQQTLRIGLRARPEDRHADMEALVAAFSPRRQGSRVAALVAGAALAGLAGLVAIRPWDHGEEIVGPPAEPRALPPDDRAALPTILDPAFAVVSPRTGHGDDECARAPVFDRPRRDLEYSRTRLQATVDEDRAAGRASDAAALEGLAEVELALGARTEACARLARLGEAGRTDAACWRRAYCLGEGLPERPRCFAGDREACARVAIKHEYELLAAKADAQAGVHDQAEVLTSAHLGFLIEVLEQGCALGDVDACTQRDSYLPAVAPHGARR